jgi:S1-C subfamily serine protease
MARAAHGPRPISLNQVPDAEPYLDDHAGRRTFGPSTTQVRILSGALVMLRRVVVSSLLTVIALVLVACGGGGDAASTTTGSVEGAQPGPIQSDIYFGALDVRPAPGGKGVLVRGVEKGSPAATSGLQHGDVITALDRNPVGSLPDLVQALNGLPATHDAGDEVNVRVSRGSRRLSLTANLAPRVYLGVDVASATGGQAGALVKSVPPGGPAASAGLRPGDVITAVDGKPIARVNGLFKAFGAYQAGDDIRITVSRKTRRLTVNATLAKRPGT